MPWQRSCIRMSERNRKSNKHKKATVSNRKDFVSISAWMCVWQWICAIFSHISRLPALFFKTHLSLGVCAPLSRLFKFSSVRGGEEGNIRCQLLLFPVFLHIIIHRLFNLLSLNENPYQPLTHLPVGEEKKFVWVVGALVLLNSFQLKKKKKEMYEQNTLNWTLKNKGEVGTKLYLLLWSLYCG